MQKIMNLIAREDRWTDDLSLCFSLNDSRPSPSVNLLNFISSFSSLSEVIKHSFL